MSKSSALIVALLVAASPAEAEELPAITGNEVIVLEGRAPPKIEARPKQRVRGSGSNLDNTFLRVAPAYSDQAIESDAWTVAWMLLDIDERGTVTRAKFLKYPGYGLEKLALRTALDLAFEPAIAHDGKPIHSYLVWPIEWPSYGWLLKRTGLASGIPDTSHVPCRGSGPVHMGALHRTYRDCAPPDVKKANTEPWLGAQAAGMKPSARPGR